MPEDDVVGLQVGARDIAFCKNDGNVYATDNLTGAMGVTEDKKSKWITHWVRLGLEAIEIELKRVERRAEFCFGDTPTLADCCLVPQVFSAQRFDVDLSGCPRVIRNGPPDF